MFLLFDLLFIVYFYGFIALIFCCFWDYKSNCTNLFNFFHLSLFVSRFLHRSNLFGDQYLFASWFIASDLISWKGQIIQLNSKTLYIVARLLLQNIQLANIEISSAYLFTSDFLSRRPLKISEIFDIGFGAYRWMFYKFGFLQ